MQDKKVGTTYGISYCTGQKVFYIHSNVARFNKWWFPVVPIMFFLTNLFKSMNNQFVAKYIPGGKLLTLG